MMPAITARPATTAAVRAFLSIIFDFIRCILVYHGQIRFFLYCTRVNPLVSFAAGHIKNMLAKSLKRAPSERVLVVYDKQSGLSKVMADAYQMAIPDAEFM